MVKRNGATPGKRSLPDFMIKEEKVYHFLRKGDIVYIQDHADHCEILTVHGQSIKTNVAFDKVKAQPLLSDDFISFQDWLFNADHIKGVKQKDKDINIYLTGSITVRCLRKDDESGTKRWKGMLLC